MQLSNKNHFQSQVWNLKVRWSGKMNTYSGAQVLTVKELKNRDIMHCGISGGKCMIWTVTEIDNKYAYVRVGGTLVKMTGHDIRSGLPMFRATECPVCEVLANKENVELLPAEQVTFISQILEAANVVSALSNVDNVRVKSTSGQGGAAITSRKKYIEARTAAIIQSLLRNAK